MQTIMARFIKDESGATAIEYGLLAALIGVGIIGGASALGSKLDTSFETIATKVEGESTSFSNETGE